MTYFLHIKGTFNFSDPNTQVVLAPLSPFYSGSHGVSNFGDNAYEFAQPKHYHYTCFFLKDGVENIPSISTTLPAIANTISHFAANTEDADDMPNVVFSSLTDAPCELNYMQKSPSYLAFMTRKAENDVKVYSGEISRITHQDYHSQSQSYSKIDLYNCFHQDAPVHVIGSDDGHAGINSWNLS